MKFSNRVQDMQFSPIRKFNPVAAKVKEQGKKVYHFNIGQPDVATPECFMQAIKSFDEAVIKYAESGGLTSLQDSVIDYFKMYDMHYDRKDMIVTNGGSEALTMAFLALVNPGEEVLIAEPFYTNYHSFLTTAGGKVVPITTKAEDGFTYATREQIEPLINEKTRAICCISPGNPTGNVLTLEEMKLIGEIAKEHDLFIIADEVYREFAYDDREVTSFGMLPEIADRVIIIDSVSKRFSACGARIGFVASKNEEFMTGIIKLAQSRLCVSTLEQIGSTELFKLPSSYYEEMKEEYCKRRDAAYEEIMQIPDVICHKPGGAFYMMIDLPIEDAEDFLMFLLTEYRDNNETVMFAPAGGFYGTPGKGKSEIRIAYVLESGYIKRACQLIRTGLEAYKTKMSK